MSLFCDTELFRTLSKSEIFSHSDLCLQGVSYELFALAIGLGTACHLPLLATFIRGSMGMEHADTRSKDSIQGPSSKDMANTTVVSTFLMVVCGCVWMRAVSVFLLIKWKSSGPVRSLHPLYLPSHSNSGEEATHLLCFSGD